ncbi:MAG TPA: hypothetical protein VF175_06495 [Lacipirellula sp.]
MGLVLQIVIALVVVVGLITIIMSVKNWHWAQMVLLLAIFFTSLGVLFLGLEVFRIHRNLRAGMPATREKIEQFERLNFALEQGTQDQELINRAFAGEPFNGEVPPLVQEEGRMPGLGYWEQQLADWRRDRGPVWNNVTAAGPLDPATGRIAVAIPQQPHGLAAESIVFLFEDGPVNAAAPDQARQYLGEFRVAEAGENGVILEPVHRLDQRTGNRLLRSAQAKTPWRMYETMPLDRHELFADLSDEELRQLLPAASVEEYIRHGGEPTPDDDEYHRAAYNEKGERVELDDPAKTEERYDRPLRDYAFLFAELMRQRTILGATIAGITEDINRLKAAQENAAQLTAHREQQLEMLTGDRDMMVRDQQTIEKLRDAVLAALENARQRVADLIPQNVQLAQQLIQQQTARLPAAAIPADGGAFTGTQP